MNMYEPETLDKFIEAEQAEILQLQNILEKSRDEFVSRMDRQREVLMYVGYILLWICLVFALSAGLVIHYEMMHLDQLPAYIVLPSGFILSVAVSKHVGNLRKFRQSLQGSCAIDNLDSMIRQKQKKLEELQNTKGHVEQAIAGN